ncbi:beta-hydroxyacyl-ACP dehydratase [Bremerella sp. JC770]|uniref:3-hydroxyacyl-ACP dehydratase FabZ family protein n=1 Tax=Bremerella sp. JC770 TaxID=3232137 RepID=UPI00345A7753
MAREDLILDPASIDFDNVIADLEAVRKTNPQRYEMEQLTGIVYDDVEAGICAGYLDIGPDAFWVRGHMPGMPLMPGVLMCEMAAQVSTWYVVTHDLMPGKRMGFGGLDEVKFRGIVRPGDRLVCVLKQTRYRPNRMLVCAFQSFVGSTMVAEGVIRGIPLPDAI